VTPVSGFLVLIVSFGLLAYGGYVFVEAVREPSVAGIVAALGIELLAILCWFGLFVVQPGQARVLQLFGHYVGTARTAGLRFANPFYSAHSISLRIRNFETSKLKVNDARGNPIETAAVVVWQVTDTAEALFNVDDFTNFVHVQSEAALRTLATAYPYEAFDGEGVALSSHTAEISEQLRAEVQKRLADAGVSVVEARISHLAYSPEIAQSMLQRQQAMAVVAARQQIVQGAVGMVESALKMLAADQIVHLDEERKAAMVTNLLVVLCGDRAPQPVVNASSLYH
jgi:regulator of protease activity HflC (stomatin/prohibitin superfamily)